MGWAEPWVISQLTLIRKTPLPGKKPHPSPSWLSLRRAQWRLTQYSWLGQLSPKTLPNVLFAWLLLLVTYKMSLSRRNLWFGFLRNCFLDGKFKKRNTKLWHVLKQFSERLLSTRNQLDIMIVRTSSGKDEKNDDACCWQWRVGNRPPVQPLRRSTYRYVFQNFKNGCNPWPRNSARVTYPKETAIHVLKDTFYKNGSLLFAIEKN